jgi:hypothetical protein
MSPTQARHDFLLHEPPSLCEYTSTRWVHPTARASTLAHRQRLRSSLGPHHDVAIIVRVTFERALTCVFSCLPTTLSVSRFRFTVTTGDRTSLCIHWRARTKLRPLTFLKLRRVMALTGTLFLFRVQGTRTSTTQQHNRCTLPRALRACTLPRAPQTRTPPQARSGRMRRQPCVTRYGDRQTMQGRANKDQSALFFLVSCFLFTFCCMFNRSNLV